MDRHENDILVVGSGSKKYPAPEIERGFGTVCYVNCHEKNHLGDGRYKCVTNLNQAKRIPVYENHGDNLLVYTPDIWSKGRLSPKAKVPSKFRGCEIIGDGLPPHITDEIKSRGVGWPSTGLGVILHFLNKYPSKKIFTWGMSHFDEDGNAKRPPHLKRKIHVAGGKNNHDMDVEHAVASHISTFGRVFRYRDRN